MKLAGDLGEPLMRDAAVVGNGDVNAEWLSDLFQPDNVRTFKSNRKLDSIGGYAGIERCLKTSLKNGISEGPQDLNWRANGFGTNDPIVKDPKTLCEMIMENFEDQTIQILCFAAIVSLVLGVAMHGIKEGWLEGVSIILAVVIITAVTSINNYMKEKQFRKLYQIATQKKVNVIRKGDVVNMSVYDVLVGDIVQVQTGEVVSVDGLVFKASRLVTDESNATGQSDPIKKADYVAGLNNNPFLISGSKVSEGTCFIVVLAVGTRSREGITKSKLTQEDDQTPLQVKLGVLAEQIGTLGIWSATLTFAALVLHLLWEVITGTKCLLCGQFFSDLVAAFIIAVSIVVIAVPEGLPLAVTISLAYSVGKMKEQNNLVRVLSACQTMGGANNVCTDKTGTLTKNQMSVIKLWSERQVHRSFGPNISLKPLTKEMLMIGSCLNSDAQPKISSTRVEQVGNRTECALLEMAYKAGYDYTNVRKTEEVRDRIPFSSLRKRMSCFYEKNKKLYIFTKGAPDFLLSFCKFYIAEDGQARPITPQYLSEHEKMIQEFSGMCLRTLLLCYRELKPQEAVRPLSEDMEKDLVILGLVGIQDPLKENVPNAVIACKRAGVKVRMVTGDNTETATAIAKEANIIPKDFVRPRKGEPGYYVILEGAEFRETVGALNVEKGPDGKILSETIKDLNAFTTIVNQLRVLARSSPEDKYLLVTGLKQLKNVVAVTGDGGNDAPALKKADIGFAMGINGSEIARQVSGIILLDDDFSSVVTAIKYGRNIFECIRKFLQFQLTVNVVAIFMAFLGAVVIKESPLNAVQMLWVNLIMDTLAALALATEPPRDELLERKPYSRDEDPITPQMWKTVFFHAFFQIIVLTVILFKGASLFGVVSSIGIAPENWSVSTGEHYTIFFNVFVYLQVFNFFNARKLKREEVNVFQGVCDNYLFIMIVISIFCCQFFIVEFGGKAVKLVPLNVSQNLVCIAIGSMSLIVGVIFKLVVPETCLDSISLFKQRQETTQEVDSFFTKVYRRPVETLRNSGRRQK